MALSEFRADELRLGAGELLDGADRARSADWMARNLDFRVEAIVPVEEPRLAPTSSAPPHPGEEPRPSQDLLMQRTLERAGRTVAPG